MSVERNEATILIGKNNTIMFVHITLEKQIIVAIDDFMSSNEIVYCMNMLS